MSFQLTHQNIAHSVQEWRRRRLELEAYIEQRQREVRSLYELEMEGTRLLERMESQKRANLHLERRQ